MTNKSGYKQPVCNGCGKEIEFVLLRNFKGEIKNHPVEHDKNYIIVDSGERNAKGQYIFKSVRVLTSHFANCPAAQEFRDKNKTDKNPQGSPETGNADDKPPF